MDLLLLTIMYYKKFSIAFIQTLRVFLMNFWRLAECITAFRTPAILISCPIARNANTKIGKNIAASNIKCPFLLLIELIVYILVIIKFISIPIVHDYCIQGISPVAIFNIKLTAIIPLHVYMYKIHGSIHCMVSGDLGSKSSPLYGSTPTTDRKSVV